MLICHCKCVKEAEIDQLLDEGKSLYEIIKETGATTDCGGCSELIYKKMLERKKK